MKRPIDSSRNEPSAKSDNISANIESNRERELSFSSLEFTDRVQPSTIGMFESSISSDSIDEWLAANWQID